MAFTVDTSQVGLYGGILGNHHGGAKAAEGFAEANLQIGAQPGLIASSAELDRVRQLYDRVDQGSAERLDRTDPDPGSPPRMPSVPGLPADTSTQAVRQITHPAERLKAPIQLVNDLDNLISAGYWTQQFLDAASDALNSLSLFCGDLAYDLTNLLMNVQNTIRLIHGGVLDVVGSGGSFEARRLPAGYDHPGA